MTQKELIEILKKYPEDAIIRFWNYGELREENIREEEIIFENGIILFE